MAVKPNMMDAYRQAKANHPGMIVLFRIGDFYESFEADAAQVAKALGLTLTTRGKMPMAGFPHHSLEAHLRTLLAAGHRVAVCSQEDKVEKPNRVAPILVPTNLGILASFAATKESKYAITGIWFSVNPPAGDKPWSYTVMATNTHIGCKVDGEPIEESETDMPAPNSADIGIMAPGGLVDAKLWKEAMGNPKNDGLRWLLPTKEGLQVTCPKKTQTIPWLEGRFPPLTQIIEGSVKKKAVLDGIVNAKNMAVVFEAASLFATPGPSGEAPIKFRMVPALQSTIGIVECDFLGNRQTFVGVQMGLVE